MTHVLSTRRFVATILVAALSACSGGGLSVAPHGAGGSSGSTPPPGSTASPPPGTTAASIPYPPKADSDPFYAQPASMPDAPAGTILKSRPVTFAPVGGVALPNQAWQLQFVSHDTHGNPIAAVATVVKPTLALGGISPLLSFQYAEDSLGSQCAPSHSVTGSIADSISQEQGAEPLAGLNLGWTVVYPDHEGPFSEFAAGRLAGQITLDGIRAALQFAPLGLGTHTPVGMWGYSGGAIATSWAASLQRSYAPELNIVGFASGGTPADLSDVINNIDSNLIANQLFFSLILSGALGANRAYPSLLTPLLNAKGVAAAVALENGCAGGTGDGSAAPTGVTTDYTTTSDPLHAPNVLAVLPSIDLPQPSPEIPMANALVYHSSIDELIPIAGATKMVNAWCAAGAHVSYFVGLGDHPTFEVASAALVVAYLESRFTGVTTVVPPTASTCN
jgi:hypothetical protein